MEIFIWNIAEDNLLPRLQRLLPLIEQTKRERIAKVKRQQTALEMLSAALLLRYVLLERIGLAHDECRMEADEFGKPYLLARADIHFNISHSEQWVACAVDHKPIGIDVETVKPIDSEGIVRYFSPAEQEWLNSKEPHKRLDAFYELWTSKESYVKALGKGLSIPLHDFSVLPQTNGAVSLIPIHDDGQERCLRNYSHGAAMKLAVCARQPESAFPSKPAQADTEIVLESLEKVWLQMGGTGA